MTIIGDFAQFLTADTSGVNPVVSGRVHYNKSPQDSSRPYVWFRRQGESEELALDGTGGLKETRFDVECWATSPSTADDLAGKVKTRLHGHRGAFTNSTAQGIFVDDKDDDYEPRGNDSDDGSHVVSLEVRAFYQTT